MIKATTLQCNGGYANHKVVDLTNPNTTVDDIRDLVLYQNSLGVMYVVLTVITCAKKDALKIMETIAQAAQTEWGQAIIAIHREGFHVDPETRGAHNYDCLSPYDMQFLLDCIDASRGLLSWITVSPSLEGAVEYISEATKMKYNQVVSLGHTMASPNQIFAAHNAGATGVTHFGNAFRPAQPDPKKRDAQVLALACMDYCMVIPDGEHVPADLVRVLFDLKGAERSIIVADEGPIMHAPPGVYERVFGHLPVEVFGEGAPERIKPLAGSYWSLIDCARQAIRWGIPVGDVVLAISDNPLRFLEPALSRTGRGKTWDHMNGRGLILQNDSLEVGSF